MANYKTINFIRDSFRDYYKKQNIDCVIDISKREFGIGDYGKKISKRHLFFYNNEKLNEYLKTQTPFFISYSVGYYKYPEKRPMVNKEMYGADIVYEFDADDFDLDCQKEHDRWFCRSCKSFGKGNIDVCPNCNKNDLENFEWVCDDCLEYTKKETLRLIDVLINEFNIDKNSLIISFSGSKGYHVRITDPKIIPLSKTSRLDMANYLLLENIDLKKLGFVLKNKVWNIPNPKFAKGVSKKIFDFIEYVLNNYDSKKLSNLLNITTNKANKILAIKEEILKEMYHKYIFYKDFNLSYVFWRNFLNKAIEKIKLSIDYSVAADVYKIVRVPDTIHGGTGFLSSKIDSIDDLKKFDPFKDPVVLKSFELINIKITRPVPKFRIIDEFYGPYDPDTYLKLKKHVAIFLILKGVANLE